MRSRSLVTKRGFTLLEILLAMLIIVVGVLAIVRAFSIGLFASTDIEGMDTALNIAQARMENIKNKSFAEIVADGDSGPTADADFPNYDVTIDIANGDDPMQVDVTVEWNVKGETVSTTLATLVADY